MKHIGFVKKTNSKVIVIYKTIPGDPDSCLVVDKDALRPFEEDQIMPQLESKDGQDSFDFGDLLSRRKMPVDAMVDQSGEEVAQSITGVSVLQYLHSKSMLIKLPTHNVIMTPESNVQVPLNELNQLIADQRGVRIDDLAPKDPTNLPKDDPQKIEAKNILGRAERLILQAEELKERAYKLDESLRPKKGRPKKETVEA